MVENVLQKLCEKFDAGQARYRVVHHPAGDRSSESVAKVRGTEVGQGAKALVCMAKGNGVKQYVLAVLPADQQADLKKLAQALGATRAGLCSPEEVLDLTGCILGAVPPVALHEKLLNVADPTLFTRYGELAFNAGARDVSIIINTEDFLSSKLPKPLKLLRISAPFEIPRRGVKFSFQCQMPHIDFASILSSALTPITLISGVGLLLMAMSARYAQACDRVRENLRQQGRSPDFDPGIEERLILNYHRAELLRKAILFVVLSAASSGLLILASTLEGMFGVDLLVAKHILLLCCVGLIVISTIFFALEVTTSLKALALRKEQESAIRRRRFTN